MVGLVCRLVTFEVRSRGAVDVNVCLLTRAIVDSFQCHWPSHCPQREGDRMGIGGWDGRLKAGGGGNNEIQRKN